MSEKNNGGPAFPCKKIVSYQTSLFSSEAIPVYEEVGGMTLRDWFAGQALAGMATLYAVAGGASEDIAKANATVSYLMADAMLAERDK